jgi:acyl dehydratase
LDSKQQRPELIVTTQKDVASGHECEVDEMNSGRVEMEHLEEAGITARTQSRSGVARPADNGKISRDSIPDRYLEDFEQGMVFEFGDYLMTEDEIISFGQKYDPQPFHTERHPPSGAAHPSLIASGWHTGSATMRMLVDHFFSWRCSLPSPGPDGMRFAMPVHPGDRLRVKLTVISVRPSASKSDRGIVVLDLQTLNQMSQVVLSMRVPHFVWRRPNEIP